MDNAKQHWKILQELGNDLENRVRSFLVIGRKGEGVIVVTENGDGYWLGEMRFDEISRTATEPTLLDVPELVHMAHGESHILLLDKQGQIYTMGKNGLGQLGLGTFDQETQFLPQLISSTHCWRYRTYEHDFRCGYWHSLALAEDGKVWAWGSNYWSQVGVSNCTYPLSSPRQISDLDSRRFVAVECGGWHSLALTDQGVVYGWGKNYWGQLGNGSKLPTQLPTQIPTSSPVQRIVAGSSHTLLLTQTGEVYACGRNACGQLGLPIETESSASLVKVAGLPLISQIASHPATELSIAMSTNQRCFVWGELSNGTSISTPWELSPVFTTVESVLSSFSTYRGTSHSVPVPDKQCPNQTLPAHNRLLDRISQMFDNPDSSPDVRFQVREQSILAHRSVLQISSGHFDRLFSSNSADLNSSSSVTPTPQSGPNLFQTTTNPSEPDPNFTPITPQVTIPITDHSYPAFHAYLHFLYLGILEVSPEHLADLYSLSVAYLESDLQQLCLSRMRSTLTPATCCLYYQLTLRQSLPELDVFQQEILQFIFTNFFQVFATSPYQSMDDELCKQLILSMAKLSL